jgi:hypothetical protein
MPGVQEEAMTAPTPLASLRLRPVLEAELRWYLCESEGALGLRSSFGAQLARAEAAPGRNKGSKPLGAAVAAEWTDAQLAAVDRARCVEQRLASLSQPQQRALAAAYGPGLPREAERAWVWLAAPGSGLSVALLLLVAGRQHLGRRELRAWREQLHGKDNGARVEGRKKLASLRQDAEVALVRAGRGYEAAGKGTEREPLRRSA